MFRFFRSLRLFLFLVAGQAIAGQMPFDQATFDALRKEGKPMLVVIHADWCPTCKAQEPIISELLKTPELQAVTVLRVDFDRQKDVIKAFKAQYQSTLIVFRNGREAGRSTGETRKDGIAALLKKSL